MAKSRETWNKKELEKKKQKKKQEKEQRKEERKQNGTKSFEDMIMYVDENGNFTSTPPDPAKKRVIREEDIVINVPRQVHNPDDDGTRKGIVSFFNESKGYGFIRDQASNESIFVHANGLIDPIKDNNLVSFTVEMGQRGPQAVNVKLVK